MNDDYLNSLLEHLIDCVNETDEIEHIELKHNNYDCHLIGKSISAISNVLIYKNIDKGYIIWGIDDKTHDIVGTDFEPDKEKARGNQNLKIWLERMVTNSLFSFNLFENSINNENVVILEINKPTSSPVDFEGKRYIRIGSSTAELRNSEIESQIFQNLLVQSFEDQIAFENIVIQDLVNIIEFDYYYKLLSKSIPSDITTKIEDFQSEGFVIKDINNNYKLTNLGAILFSRDINSFNVLANKDVVVSVYSGKKKTSTLIRDESFKYGYAISLEDIVKFVNSQIPANEIIGVVFREKEQMIPELIIRELIVNALMHQDFTKRESKIHISIFQDRIEIENPGQSLVEVDRMIDSQPKTRNVKLSDFMRRVTFCEVKGTGIDKVIEESEKSLLPPPLFYSDEHFTKVTVSAFKEFRKYNKQERLTACYQHCCLKYAQNEYFTNETLRERFGLDKGEYQKVSKVISLAKEENRIV